MADVLKENENAMHTFQKKRQLWLAWLKTDEQHPISAEISSMAWNDVAFRTLARAAEIDPNSGLNNSLLAESLIYGHFAVQILHIRRMMDRRKDVISLMRLLDDIEENIGLFTRENFVVHDGLPYDYQAAMQRVMEEQSGNAGIWQDTSGPNGWFTSQRAHEIFDKLAGVDPANRKRSDRLPHTIINTLREWLTDSDAEKLVTWSHKFLAHAADGVSRQKVDMATVTPSLNKITHVLRCFIRVSEAVLAYLLFDSGHGMKVPVPQFNQFERLACPLLAYGKETELCEHWDKLSKERNDFLEGTLGSLTST